MVSCALLGGRLDLVAHGAGRQRRPPHASTGASMSVSFRAPRARLAWITIAALLLAAIAGCTLSSGGYNTTSPPKIRVFNGAIDIGAVDVTLGNVPSVSALGYEQNSTYRTASTGDELIRLTLTGTTTVLVDT